MSAQCILQIIHSPFNVEISFSWIIWYKYELKPNDCVRSKINTLVGPQKLLLATVKRRKLAWFGHVTCNDSLPKTILQSTLENGRRRGRQTKCWMDNIKELTSFPMPKQPLQNHPSGHLGGRATPWLAEEMLDGQHQRVDVPAHARTAHNNFLQKTLRENLC